MDDGAELLVVVGGDGAFHEVVNGIVGRDVEVALMMRGTGMDFPRTYGIPTKPEEAARVAANGVAREIDLGKVTYRSWAGVEATEYFANIGSAGMSAAVARRANSKSKAMGGKASFFVALVEVFFGWRNAEMHVRVDDEERSGLFNNTVVANGQYHGGGMWLAPEARPDDGLFDVLVFGDLTKTDFVRNVGKIYKGTHLSHPKIEQLRGARVEIDADRAAPHRARRGAARNHARALRDRAARAARARSGLGRLLLLAVFRDADVLRAVAVFRELEPEGFERRSTLRSRSSTRFSSFSIPRTLLASVSTWSLRFVTAPVTRSIPAEEASRLSTSSPASASLVSTSVCLVFAIEAPLRSVSAPVPCQTCAHAL